MCGSPFGKVKRVSRPRKLPGDPVVWNVYVYDGFGRTVEVRHAPVTGNGAAGSQGKTMYVYDVEGTPARGTVKITDPAGRWKKEWRNGFGDLVNVTEPNPSGGEYTTAYTYTALGALKNVTMTRNGYKNGASGQRTQTRTFVYNNDGTLQSTTFPETGTTTYTYSNGRVETQTDAHNRKREWVYTNGRLTQIKRFYSGVEKTAERTIYTYDAYGRMKTVKYGTQQIGQATETYDYFASGQLQAKTLGLPWGGNLKAEFEYDSDGRPWRTKYPQGETLFMKYDNASRPYELWKVTGTPTGELQATAEYDWRGLMTQMNNGSGEILQTWNYNIGGQMTFHSVSGTLVTYNYETVAPVTGKLQSMTQNYNTVTYDYDELGRLKWATSPAWSQNYTYDGFANLVKKTGTGAVDWTSSFNSETNGAPAVPLAGHDADNRWITVDDYRRNLYDASNQRVIEWTHHGEDPNGNNLDTAIVTFRVGGRMLGRYTYQLSGGVPSQMFGGGYKYLGGRRVGVGSDRLGSDLTGNRTLLPYGEELSPTANGTLKFATYWRDAATGMDYADQRYYSPGTGRFLTADPFNASAGAENPSSWNRYAYVEGDPVNFGDPQGLAKAPAQPDTFTFSITAFASSGAVPIGDIFSPSAMDRVPGSGTYIPLSLERELRCESASQPELSNSDLEEFLGGVEMDAEEMAEVYALPGGKPDGQKDVLPAFVYAASTAATWTVYWARTPQGQYYIGVTSQFAQRQLAHLAKSGFRIEQIPGIPALNYAAAKGVEQKLIESFLRGGAQLANKINSIAPNNRFYQQFTGMGHQVLRDCQAKLPPGFPWP